MDATASKNKGTKTIVINIESIKDNGSFLNVKWYNNFKKILVKLDMA